MLRAITMRFISAGRRMLGVGCLDIVRMEMRLLDLTKESNYSLKHT